MSLLHATLHKYRAVIKVRAWTVSLVHSTLHDHTSTLNHLAERYTQKNAIQRQIHNIIREYVVLKDP